MSNQKLGNELHKPIDRKSNNIKVCSFLKTNLAVDLADMQLISKCNKGIRYLLCAFDRFSRYLWVVLLKHKKGITRVNAFQNILKKSNRKPNKIWVDQDSQFYKKLF